MKYTVPTSVKYKYFNFFKFKITAVNICEIHLIFNLKKNIFIDASILKLFKIKSKDKI